MALSEARSERRCVVCGRRLPYSGDHTCPRKTLARRAREEREAEADGDEPEPDYDDRLADGFWLMRGAG